MPSVYPTFAVSVSPTAVTRIIAAAARKATITTAQITETTGEDSMHVLCSDAKRYLDLAEVLSAWRNSNADSDVLVLIACPIDTIECDFGGTTPVVRFPNYQAIGVDLIPCIAAGLIIPD
jgi:hypothetical protein